MYIDHKDLRFFFFFFIVAYLSYLTVIFTSSLIDKYILLVMTQMFWLDKSTSKRCYMLSARELSITWGNDQLYWSWKPFIQSRFVNNINQLNLITALYLFGTVKGVSRIFIT